MAGDEHRDTPAASGDFHSTSELPLDVRLFQITNS